MGWWRPNLPYCAENTFFEPQKTNHFGKKLHFVPFLYPGGGGVTYSVI